MYIAAASPVEEEEEDDGYGEDSSAVFPEVEADGIG